MVGWKNGDPPLDGGAALIVEIFQQSKEKVLMRSESIEIEISSVGLRQKSENEAVVEAASREGRVMAICL
jgi:hypothetical protein